MSQELVIVHNNMNDNYSVKDIGGTYPKGSTLEGQTLIKFVDSFDTIEDAKKAYPNATVTHSLMMPVNTFDHLPDEPDY